MARAGFAIFRHGDFRNFVGSRLLWGLSSQMLTVAVAWRIYEITHDPLALGLSGLFAFAPALPMSLIAGAVADRCDRRLVLFWVYGLLATGLVLFLAFAGARTTWPAYGLVVVAASARAFSNPAAQALMTSLVPKEDFAAATAWSSTVNQTATILGPSLGGLLYPLGSRVPFAVALVCALGALTLNVFVAPARAASGAARAPVTPAMLVAGFRFAIGAPAILGAITLDLVAVLFGGATALLPIYASDVYHVGAWGLGLLRSSPACGSILAALALAHAPLRRRVGWIMLSAVCAYGVATIGLGLSDRMWVGMLCLAALGAADVVSVVVRQSLIQIDTPDGMRGRVVAFHNILTSAANNLGDLESGALASWIGATRTIVFGGVCALAAAGLWWRLFPALRNRNSLMGDG